uniref:EF-hand domain-containing protein n=1 Tax=Anopheles culicifacies TaxID=139723 RepID=A0A182LSL9_9DIPT
MYKMFFPSGNAEEFCDHVFRTFDMDKNGYIDFKSMQSVCLSKCNKNGYIVVNGSQNSLFKQRWYDLSSVFKGPFSPCRKLLALFAPLAYTKEMFLFLFSILAIKR